MKKENRSYLNLLILFTLSLLFSINGNSASSCNNLFSSDLFNSAINGSQINSFQLLIELENKYNRPEYSREPIKVIVPTAKIGISKLNVEYTSNNISEQGIVNHLINGIGKKVNWFQHPFNTSSAVPYFRNKQYDGVEGYLSASRSIFFEFEGSYLSIRTPTDHPRGPHSKVELSKIEIASELENASHLMKIINSQDLFLSIKTQFIIAKEIGVIRNIDSTLEKSGFMIRSLEFLKTPDKYYIPAFSIQQIGEAIAKKQGIQFEKFWQKHYVEPLARAQVQLLLKYGLQMDFPHGQNILFEVDSNFIPTGKIVFRDIDDMSQNSSVFQTLNRYLSSIGKNPYQINHNSLKAHLNLQYLWDRFVKRVVSNSKDPQIYNESLNSNWYTAYIKAYIKELALQLEIKPSDIGKTAEDINSFITSTWAQQLIERLYQMNFKE